MKSCLRSPFSVRSEYAMNLDGQLTSHGIHPFSRQMAEIFLYLDERPVTDLFYTIKKLPPFIFGQQIGFTQLTGEQVLAAHDF